MAASAASRSVIPLFAAVALLVAACANNSGTPTPAVPSAGSAGASASISTSSTSSSAPGSSAAPAGSSAPSGSSGGSPFPNNSGQTGTGASPTPPLTGGQGPDGSGPAGTLQQQFVSIVNKVNPSVVVIETSEGLGSGVVFDTKGDIVTNAHVAGSSTSFTVTTADGHSLKGTLVGVFVPDDVAVIHVSGATPPAASFGDSSALSIGDIVLAIGNPLGLQSSVTEGIVSATGRVVSEPTGSSIPNMIQTSAAINPGNSGGALVDLAGQVIGIPTLAASDPQMGGSAPGIGFAVSSNMASDIARQLITSGKVTNSHRAYMGVQLAHLQQGGGALVVQVVSGGPASKAGIHAGDLITTVAGKPVADSSALSDVLATMQPGQSLDLGVETQAGTTKTVHVTLGSYPSS